MERASPTVAPGRCQRCAELEERIDALEQQIAALRQAAASAPLRYRLVDDLNRALHAVPGLHPALKWLAAAVRDRSPGTGDPAGKTVPDRVPAPDVRRELAERYLAGTGIEIGALQNPLHVPARAEVRYVDRLTLAEARAAYPELDGQPLVDPGIIAEADRLSPIASGTLDFVIANHVLEHLRDPLSALGEWLRVLRPGGHLYVAVPDRDNPFDRHRTVSEFEHLLEDVASPAGRSRQQEDRDHYLEWARATLPDASTGTQEARAAELDARAYAIHFHVFDRALFERALRHACAAGASVVELRTNPTEPEHIAIVRRSA